MMLVVVAVFFLVPKNRLNGALMCASQHLHVLLSSESRHFRYSHFLHLVLRICLPSHV